MITIAILGLFLIISLIFIFRYRALKSRVIKKLRSKDIQITGEWAPEFLQEKRKHTDSLADKVVETIMSKNEEGEVNHLFGMFNRDRDHLPANTPKELVQYFEETAKLPEWADPDLLALGQQIYIRHGVWISLLLSYKSLPECYACAKGAEVLFHTARLTEKNGSFDTYSRRIAETAQFVLFTMSPRGLGIKGRGMVAAQKVRLIHAIIRYYLKKQGWDEDTFDAPINQEDMAGTLMSFSALILEGLEQIGIILEDFEKEAYIHCWRVVGHIMGLHDDMIPANAKDALKLGHAILDHQKGESEHGKALTRALIDFQNQPSRSMMSADKNIAMMRLMMGDEICGLLGIPDADKEDVSKLARKFKRITKTAEFLDHSLIFAMIIQFISKIGLQLVIKKMTKSKILNFYLPKSLTMDWGILSRSSK